MGDNGDVNYAVQLLIDTFSPLESYFDTIVSHLLSTTLIHPLQCSSTLLFLGYWPLMHPESAWYYIDLILPAFAYAKEIYYEEGITGCFRGFTARIVLNFLSKTAHFHIAINKVEHHLNSNTETKFHEILKWNVIGVIVGDIISHPFFLVSNRQIAQYIGKETLYSHGILKALFDVAKNEGVLKWFSGLMPKVIADVTVLIVVYHSVHTFSSYTREKKYINYFMYGMIAVVSHITYPFYKVSTWMTVDGSGLKAGTPLLMTNYGLDWVKCFNDLSRNNQLYTGSSLFWRPHIPLIKSN